MNTITIVTKKGGKPYASLFKKRHVIMDIFVLTKFGRFGFGPRPLQDIFRIYSTCSKQNTK